MASVPFGGLVRKNSTEIRPCFKIHQSAVVLRFDQDDFSFVPLLLENRILQALKAGQGKTKKKKMKALAESKKS